MSELRDYQRVLVDNILEDIADITGFDRSCLDMERIEAKLESRIVAYDNERRDQIIRDLSASLPRLVEGII